MLSAYKVTVDCQETQGTFCANAPFVPLFLSHGIKAVEKASATGIRTPKELNSPHPLVRETKSVL